MKLATNSKECCINYHNNRIIINGKKKKIYWTTVINIELIISKIVNSKWFHWYEKSLPHIISWCSYIGIDNELMVQVTNQLMELYLSEYG